MTKAKRAVTEKDLQKLGTVMQSLIEEGHINHSKVYRVNFVRGIAFGFGVAIGSTILFAFLAWLIGQFTELPIIGDFFETIQKSTE